jgi:hypothetical protein
LNPLAAGAGFNPIRRSIASFPQKKRNPLLTIVHPDVAPQGWPTAGRA